MSGEGFIDNHFLHERRVKGGSTHVGMGSVKGAFRLNRHEIDGMFSAPLDPFMGLAERGQDFSMLRFDLDFKSTRLEETEFDIGAITTEAITKIRGYLDQWLIPTATNNTDICVLTKPPYIQDGVKKYGAHLVLPSVFLSLDEFKRVEHDLSTEIEGLDKISSNPWLLYGQQKNEHSGSYVAEYVDVQGERVDVEKYYENYTVYDASDEEVVSPDKLRRIFSIIPKGREVSGLMSVPPPVVQREVAKETREHDENPKTHDEMVDIASRLTGMLSPQRAETYQEWLAVGWALHSMSKDDDFLAVWKDFSRSAPNYDEAVCDLKWAGMKDGGISVGSLYFWAKIDSPGPFKELLVERNAELIAKSRDGSHKDFALVFDKLYAANIRVTDTNLSYYHWNDKTKLWILSDKSTLPLLISQVLTPVYDKMWRDAFDELERTPDPPEQAVLKQKIGQLAKTKANLNSAPFLKNVMVMYAGIEFDPLFESEVVNKTAHELPIRNGMVIDLKTLKVRPRTIVDYWSHECPVDYLGADADLSCVTDFFDAISCGDPELVDYHRRMWGYFLTGEISERDLTILWGNGCNGKSSVVNIFSKILKGFCAALNENLMLKKNTGGASPELMALLHARLGVLPESDRSEELNSKRVKSVTGDDVINARHLYGHAVQFKTQAAIVWATNYKPDIDIDDQAILDRVKLIPFLARFEKTPENTKYIKDLQENKTSEFFTWFCGGARDWYAGASLEPCTVMRDAMVEYIHENDVVQEFIDETLLITDEAEYEALAKLAKASKRMAKKAVFDEYRFWARNGSASGTTAKAFHDMFGKKCATKKILGNRFYLCSRQPGAEDEGGEDEGEDEGGRLLTGGK
jgi:P4 family phage/plasmid primase-like protien